MKRLKHTLCIMLALVVTLTSVTLLPVSAETDGDAVITVPITVQEEYDMAQEFFEILTLKSLDRLDRPIVLYNINGYYDLMKKLLEHTADQAFMGKEVLDLCKFMDDPKEILDYIENYR